MHPIIGIILAYIFLNFNALLEAQPLKAPLEAAPIKIGMSSALSGPAAQLGLGMRAGIQAYFNKVNADGGIEGRPLELVALDDGYEPPRAASNMRQLIDRDQVLAVIGNVGTPTAIVTVPVANSQKTLLFAPFTGSGILRKTPPDRYIINFRASYGDEIKSMIEGLLSIGIRPEEMAFFTQNDAYGDSGYQAILKTLKEKGFAHPELLPYGRYTRNTLNVEEGLAHILLGAKKPPRAFIIVGAYAPVAAFIHLAKEEFPNALFLNVSFVGTDSLAKALKDKTDNVIVTEVVPPLTLDLPAIQEYRRDMAQYNPDATPTFTSLEGYLAAKLFVDGVRKAAANHMLTREGLIDTFEQMKDVDIGIGAKIDFSKTDHQALQTVWPIYMKGSNFIPLDWSRFQPGTSESSEHAPPERTSQGSSSLQPEPRHPAERREELKP